MFIDRSPIDRGAIDRGNGPTHYIFSLAISGTANVSELTDRVIPLSISGTGSPAAPSFLRLIDLAIAGNGALSTPLFDWYFSMGFSGTGGFLNTGGSPVKVHGGLLMDRGFIDRGTVVGSGCVNCIPPVLVDRTIPLVIAGTGHLSTPIWDWFFSYGISGTGELATPSINRTIPLAISGTGILAPLIDRTIPLSISGTGSMAWDFCRLYDLAIAGTGQMSIPLFDWQFSYGISGTGQMSIPLVNRTLLLELFGTGKFTSEEFTRYIDIFFGGTGQISTPVPFIPVHYLTAAINGTAHFWDPALLREITNISALIKGGTVKRSLADKMFTANIDFAINTAHSMLNTNPWQKVTFYQPDYAGNFHPIFVGIFPSSRQNITAAAMPNLRPESETIVAYDYAWYLAAQYVSNWIDDDGVPHNEQILLTPADQAKQIIHHLLFHSPQPGYTFKPGQWVVGGSSANYGMIIEVNAGGLSNAIRLEYLGPGAGPFFTADEQLKVGGVVYAYADSHTTDETGTPPTMYPEDYITELLGGGTLPSTLGDYWQYTTGIYPYRMNNITIGWTLMPAIEFPFTLQTTKAQAIEKICKYCRAVFYVKWRNDISGFEGTYIPAAYLVKQSEIDDPYDGLDLPTAADLTYGGGISAADLGRYIKGTISADFKGEDQYNWVVIRCQDLNGNWLESAKAPGSIGGVSWGDIVGGSVYDPVINPSGTEIKRAYYEETAEFSTQLDLNLRAADIYAYYHFQINTWKATFYKRSDLELLQQIVVSGFGANILPDGTYRIIDIQYDYSDGGAKNEVTVTFIKDSQFVTYLNLRRVFYNSIYEIQNVVNDVISNKLGAVYGTVTEVGTGYVKFAVNQNGAITKYYTGISTGKAPIVKGDRVFAVPDSKGNYIVLISS